MVAYPVYQLPAPHALKRMYGVVDMIKTLQTCFLIIRPLSVRRNVLLFVLLSDAYLKTVFILTICITINIDREEHAGGCITGHNVFSILVVIVDGNLTLF